ncbi:MAG: hypothetical protein AAFO74_05965 [Pseudomonadota bacterium]
MDLLGFDLSWWLYSAATLCTLLIGILYAFRSKIMPYHLQALETEWDEIDPKYQFMLLALLNGGGYFGIATGLFMAYLLFGPIRGGDAMAGYALGAIGLVGTAPLTFIVHKVKTRTAGNPPLFVMFIVCGLLLGGLVATAVQ